MIVEKYNKLGGIYRGIVLKHLPHGKCKIFIPGIYSDEYKTDPDLLPTAEQAAPLFAGCNTGNGVFSYPNLSSIVWCMFANGDLNLPIYIAAVLGGNNAFGQYEIVLSARNQNDGKQLSDIILHESISDKHLITSGKTQVELFENGKLSVYVSDPIVTDAKVVFDNEYCIQEQDDYVKSRPIAELIMQNQISNINCQIVADNEEKNGTVKTSTHQFNINDDKTLLTSIDTLYQQGNDTDLNSYSIFSVADQHECKELQSNITNASALSSSNMIRHIKNLSGKQILDTINSFTTEYNGIVINLKHSDDSLTATGSIKINSTSDTGIFLTSDNNLTHIKYINTASTKDGKFEIKIENTVSGKKSYIYCDKDGNITICSNTSITLSSDLIKLKALTQLDIDAPYVQFRSDTAFNVKSPSILLDSTDGKTVVKSMSGTTPF